MNRSTIQYTTILLRKIVIDLNPGKAYNKSESQNPFRKIVSGPNLTLKLKGPISTVGRPVLPASKVKPGRPYYKHSFQLAVLAASKPKAGISNTASSCTVLKKTNSIDQSRLVQTTLLRH